MHYPRHMLRALRRVLETAVPVRGKRAAGLAVALMLALAPVHGSVALAFDDVAPDGADSVILQLKEKGIVHGDGRSFEGGRTLTLAEGLAMIVRGLALAPEPEASGADAAPSAGGSPEADGAFARVPDDAWYADAFRAAARGGLDVPRDADPAQAMSREQFLHLLGQALQQTGEYAFPLRFFRIADAEDITPGLEPSIQRMLNGGFVQLDEDGRLHPQEPVTRREAAVVLHAVLAFAERHRAAVPGKTCESSAEPSGESGMNMPDGAAGNASGDMSAGPPGEVSGKNGGDALQVRDDVTCTVERVNEDIVKVVLSRGEKPTSGYGIEIAAIVFPDGETAEIRYRTHDPEPGSMLLQVITHPTATAYLPAGYGVVLKRVEGDALAP